MVEIKLPPLRERQEDIPLMLEKFIAIQAQKNALPIKKVHPELLAFLQSYCWPGNIRELMNVVECLMISSEHPNWLTLDDLPTHITTACTSGSFTAAPADLNLKQAVEHLERSFILDALRRTGNNRVKAAALLNIPRVTLYKKIHDYSLE
ncbi:Transcriptional regulatory protein ZraR [Leminorella richardii]|uniref:Transcriptional regulatory protein ZraR n=1 Tax=Leminorella richardii TaxID=158841 RepID=A0A2X4VA23_9GAMM|nr:helix-turn-helix domain-containing protein [Leminorella richardii]SQI42160.1 Transcriptional regulatory protein ZraR [Leminorella richardii]